MSDHVRDGKGKSLIYFPSEYVVVDVETSGLYPGIDEIIELAALKVHNNKKADIFQCLCKPKRDVDGFISSLTGITNEMLKDATASKDSLPSFLAFIGDAPIVGHNASFDVNFIYDEAQFYLGYTFSNNYIDSCRISKLLYPDLPHHRLKDLVKLLNIPTNDFHRAKSDCMTTLYLFEQMRLEVIDKFGSTELFAEKCKKNHAKKFDAKGITSQTDEFDISHPLYGKYCVFTGALERMKRADAAQIVADFGGICENTVTKSTNFLILGNNDYCSSIKDGKSEKQKKAEEKKLKGQDIEIIPEIVFYDMIEEE